MFHEEARRFFEILDYEALRKCPTAREAYRLFEKLPLNHPAIKPLLANFFTFEASRWEYVREKAKDPIFWWKPVACELELSVGDVELHVDRIDRISTGTLINLEYKTGVLWNISDLRWETTFYNIYINESKRFEEPCTHIGAYNPRLQKWFEEQCSQRLIKRTKRLIEEFRNAQTFPPRQSNFCYICPASTRCLEEGIFNELQTSGLNKGTGNNSNGGELLER